MEFTEEQLKAIDEHFAEAEKSMKENEKKIRTMFANPDSVKDLLSKVVNSKQQAFTSDSFFENNVITEDEFYLLFDVLREFMNLTNCYYSNEEIDENMYFPANVGHIVFEGKIITAAEIYGQGTLTTIVVEQNLDKLNDLTIPVCSFDKFVRLGAEMYQNKEMINKKNDEIYLLNKIVDSIDDALNSEGLGNKTTLKLQTMKFELFDQIDTIKKEISYDE